MGTSCEHRAVSCARSGCTRCSAGHRPAARSPPRQRRGPVGVDAALRGLTRHEHMPPAHNLRVPLGRSSCAHETRACRPRRLKSSLHCRSSTRTQCSTGFSRGRVSYPRGCGTRSSRRSARGGVSGPRCNSSRPSARGSHPSSPSVPRSRRRARRRGHPGDRSSARGTRRSRTCRRAGRGSGPRGR